MKLAPDTVIPDEKLTNYLLVARTRNDKSGFFAMAGYTQDNWGRLQHDLREQILPLDAEFSRHTPFGDLYTIQGLLRGPNGTTLRTRSVWLVEPDGKTRLITIYPARGG